MKPVQFRCCDRLLHHSDICTKANQCGIIHMIASAIARGSQHRKSEGIIATTSLRAPENLDQLLMSTAIGTKVVPDSAAMATRAVVGGVIVHDLRLPELLSKNAGWDLRRITKVSIRCPWRGSGRM